ncbi:MAG: phosphodiester glycosidase family protein [Armatimonadetes bacterium]|nr:phosphodiester glycosidase family protein [Armatimonadota bacterium]
MPCRPRCWLLAACLLLPIAIARGEEAPPLFPEVVAGLEYVHERIGDVPWAIHVVKIDRSRPEFRLATTLARGTILGLSPLTEQIRALPPALGQPVAAVNADFFWIRPGPYQGDPSGLQILHGELVSAAGGPSFWIDREGKPRLGEVTTKLRARWPGGAETPLGLNQERAEDAAVLYTPSLGASTRTTGGRELVLESVPDHPWLPLRVGPTCSARVREIREAGDTPLQPGSMVLSLGPKLQASLPEVRPGDQVSLLVETEPDLSGVEVAIGGGPILVHEGKAGEWAPPQPRHPRTAIGWNDRHLMLVVVDGRRRGFSEGMTFPELAALMQRLGCTEAINLDGGGSSTLWLGGKVVNLPSDGRERAIANGLVVLRAATEH